jgi:WD40 repeat protein/tRNA A-37 threonylcarbamoyl transferase component Bud32
MHILCPHCHNPVEVVKLSAREEVACPSCGSSFRLEADSTTDPENSSLQKLGRFELLGVLGRGGFGTVYKARDPELDRTVAVKVPRAGNLAEAQELDRFLREARSAAQLRHPSIVTVHEVGQSDGLPYLVSDFVQGVTLADQLSARRPGFREAAELVAAVADALQYAHEQGVVHRDVKPSNIMIGADGKPCVMDFGLAKRDAGEITMTVEGQVLGTPAYMAPEQARGEGHAVDGRGDVYSLGVVLYQLLTGELPFRGTQRMLLHQVLHDEPRPPRSLNDPIPRDLETVCLKAMAKEPGRRYQTARDFADDLRRWLKGEPIQARPVGAWGRGWRWARRRPAAAALLAVSGVAALALVGLGVGLVYSLELNERNARIQSANQQLEAANTKTETALQAESEARKEERKLLYVNKLVLAEREWTAGNVGRVKRLLGECPEEARGWEWRYLDQLCRRALASVQGPKEDSEALAFSPGGNWMVTGGGAGVTVRFWSITSGRVTHQLSDTFFPAWGLDVNPDAKLLVSVGRYVGQGAQLRVKLWDVATGKEVQELTGFPGTAGNGFLRTEHPAKCAIFSPDGQWLAVASVVGGRPGAVTLWDVRTRQLVRTLTGFDRPLSGLAFSPDGNRLAYLAVTPPSARANRPVGGLKIWQTSTGVTLLEEGNLPVAPTGKPVFSPDGKHLAFPAEDGAIHIWDTQTLKEYTAFRAENDIPYLIAYSPDGNLLASTAGDGIVHLWDPVRRLRLRSLRGETGPHVGLTFSADGRRLLTCDKLNRLTTWDPHTGQDPLIVPVNSPTLVRLVVSPDGKRLACGNDDGTVKVWDAVTGQLLLILRGHRFRAMGVAFSPDGSLLATGSHDGGGVKLWDATTGQLRRSLPFKASVDVATFSPDGQYLAIASHTPGKGWDKLDTEVCVLSVASSTVVHTLRGHTSLIMDARFSPNGHRLVSASDDKTARVWDVQTGQELFCFHLHSGAVSEANFSPDGQRIASTSADQTVKVWGAATGAEILTLGGHKGATVGVAFSRDGRRLASSSDDGTVKIWDAGTGEELLTLRGHQGPVAGVVFGPEDRWLASMSQQEGDRTIRIWEATPLTSERRLQREAAALVNDLPSHLGFKDEILAYLRDVPSLSASLRQRALNMAERLQEDAWRLNRAGAVVVRQPGLDAAKYRLALRHAQAAQDLAHPGFYYRLPDYHAATNIGIAHYLLGQYPEAVKSLTRSEDFYAVAPYQIKAGTPWNLAFLAMAHHQLGEKEEARAILARLNGVMKAPRWASPGDHHLYLRETEELIEGKARDPKK